MYNDYFAFNEPPFSIAPDPRYLYMSSQHREALAHLLYGVEGDGGFVLLTGDVGTGKTTVCRCLLETLPEYCDVAFIYNPKLTVQELLATICEEFGLKAQTATSNKIFVAHINGFLLDSHAKGRKAVLIVDEAQNLAVDVLEQLRLLTNLETNERKLLQIILLGQPELQDLLARRELRQLAQRIVARYHLLPLSKTEVTAYVSHRLTVAGSGRQLFTPAALRHIYRLSDGVPRVINLLCDRALLGAYVQGKDSVDRKTLLKAAREVLGESGGPGRWRAIGWTAALVALGGSAVLAIAFYQHTGQVSGDSRPQKSTALATLTPGAELPAYDTLAVPEGTSKSESESMAMAALLSLWGQSYEVNGGAPLCRQAQSQGLRCLSDRGGLHELRRLNLPAVLLLNDGRGSEFYSALTSLDERSATFVLGNGVVREVPLSVLARNWNGDYTLLWRAPPEYTGSLQEGASGKAVIWLRRQLARARGQKPVTGGESRFGPDLARQVREFQASEDLQPDGVAGPMTLIRLAARTDDDAPKLIK